MLTGQNYKGRSNPVTGIHPDNGSDLNNASNFNNGTDLNNASTFNNGSTFNNASDLNRKLSFNDARKATCKPKIKEAILVEGKYDKNTLSQVVDALIIVSNGFQVFQNPETRKYIRKLAEESGLIILTDSDASGFMIRSEIHSFVPERYLRDAYVPSVPGKEKRKDKPGKEGLLGVEGMDRETLLRALTDAGATQLPDTVSNPLGAAHERPDSGELLPSQADSQSYCADADKLRFHPLCSDSDDLLPSQTDSRSYCADTALLPPHTLSSDSGAYTLQEKPITASDLFELGLNGRPGSRERKSKLLELLELPSYLNTKELLTVLNRRMSRRELEQLCGTL